MGFPRGWLVMRSRAGPEAARQDLEDVGRGSTPIHAVELAKGDAALAAFQRGFPRFFHVREIPQLRGVDGASRVLRFHRPGQPVCSSGAELFDGIELTAEDRIARTFHTSGFSRGFARGRLLEDSVGREVFGGLDHLVGRGS